MSAMAGAPRISEGEWQVMKVIWQEPGTLAQTVIAQLGSTTQWSPATIKTLLNRLIQKGVLRFERTGKAYRYFPEFSEEECQRTESSSFLKRVFNGALSPMLAHFIHDNKLSEKELAELESLLRKGRKKQ